MYNEYLLKGKQSDAHLMIQNMCMYLDSIVVNYCGIWLTGGKLGEAFDTRIFRNLNVAMIVLNNALCGLFTSYFIKMFNSIMKAYAAGIEILLTAILSFYIFAIPISSFTILSIAIVSYATYLFAKSPVVSTDVSSKQTSAC